MTTLKASQKMKKTPVGEIPVDWEVRAVSEFVESLESGVSVNAESQPATEDESGVLKVSAVSKGRLKIEENKVIKGSELDRAKGKLRVGSVLISRSNTPDLVGDVAYVHEAPENLFLPDKLWQTQLRDALPCDTRWLTHALVQPRTRNKLRNLANGTSAGMKNISMGSFLKLRLPFPPLPEQKKIAEILGAWDRAIETQQALIDAKTERKRGLMQRLLTGQQRLPGFEGEWKVVPLSHVAENRNTANKGKLGWERLYGVTKVDGMVPMREQVRGVSTDRCKIVEANWFAYNPMRLNIGSLARWHSLNPVMVSGDYVVFECKDGHLDPRFFDHLRRSEHWEYFVKNSGSGSVRVRLYFKDIGSFKFPCPLIAEQRAIADWLDVVSREIEMHESQLKSIREQKRGLMQKLLTGEVRVIEH